MLTVLRPHVLGGYYDVFLKTYNSKRIPDSNIASKGVELTEKRKAVTSQQFIEVTFDKQT